MTSGRHDDRRLDEVDEIVSAWSAASPDVDPTGIGVYERMRHIAHSLDDLFAELDSRAGLRLGEFDLLTALHFANGVALSPSQLAGQLDLSSGQITHRIDHLEELGLLVRTISDADRRCRRIEITESGIAKARTLHRERARLQASSLRHLSPPTAAALGNVLRELMVTVSTHQWLTG